MARGTTWRFPFRMWVDNFDWADKEARKRRISIAQLLNEIIKRHRDAHPESGTAAAPLGTPPRRVM